MTKMNLEGKSKVVQDALKKYRITITKRSWHMEITNHFDLVEYETAEDWVRAAKDWLGGRIE